MMGPIKKIPNMSVIYNAHSYLATQVQTQNIAKRF